jgi:hypothetical protein
MEKEESATMTSQESSKRHWNLFARELEKLLAAHELSMSQLESDIGISHEKARRLIQSLHLPQNLPVLNPEEMKLVEQKLQLSYEESLRLRASLLAISIQKMLLYRISQDNSFIIAENVFPIILQSLEEQAQGLATQGNIRWGDGSPIADDGNAFFDPAWQNIDNADLALQLSYGVNAHAERVEKAHSAHTYFEQASANLEDADDDMRALLLWQNCHDTTQRGLHSARKRLEDLGE